MKNFKTCMTISVLVIMMVLFLVPTSATNGQNDGIKRLIAVTMLKAQTASDEAFEGADKQRKLVKQQESLRSRESAKRTAGSCEVAREKAVLQQLEAHARRSAEALESVKRLAAELERQPSR